MRRWKNKIFHLIREQFYRFLTCLLLNPFLILLFRSFLLISSLVLLTSEITVTLIKITKVVDFFINHMNIQVFCQIAYFCCDIFGNILDRFESWLNLFLRSNCLSKISDDFAQMRRIRYFLFCSKVV